METTKDFKERNFESEDSTMHTFEGHNGFFCIMFNAKCIHSVKTKQAHENKLSELIDKHSMVEI